MHWKTISFATFTAAALAVASVPALAGGGDAVGSLGTGGVLKGDISMTAGETDRITIDLVAGAPLDVTLSARFVASFSMSDPDGEPVTLPSAGGRLVRARGLAVAKTGTYTFTVSSSDGSQGLYTLTAGQRWSKAVPISGSGQATIDLPMPSAGKIAATITRQKGAPGQPRILSLFDPTGADLLAAPVEPVRNTVRLAPTPAQVNGTFRLVVTATDGSSPWKGLVKRIVPRTKPTRSSITNGIDAISFSEDGVGTFFKKTCGPCHSWAGSYSSMRGYASAAYGKMKSGSMPPGGGRIPAAQMSLVQSWIQTGRAR